MTSRRTVSAALALAAAAGAGVLLAAPAQAADGQCQAAGIATLKSIGRLQGRPARAASRSRPPCPWVSPSARAPTSPACRTRSPSSCSSPTTAPATTASSSTPGASSSLLARRPGPRWWPRPPHVEGFAAGRLAAQVGAAT